MKPWSTGLAAVLFLVAPAAAQGPALRLDFEGRQPAPAAREAAAPYTSGAARRLDFEGRQTAPPERAAGPAYTPGPARRLDFEGRQAGLAGDAKPGVSPPAKEANPVVTGVEPTGCAETAAPLSLLGERFGAAPGSRRVVLAAKGFTVPLPVSSWTDRRIAARLPADQRIRPGEAYAAGIQDPAGQWLGKPVNVTICKGAMK